MTEIVKEAKKYARQCEALGQFTTAEIILGMVDWIQVQELTIKEQKLTIAELRKVAGDKVLPPVVKTHSREQPEDHSPRPPIYPAEWTK